jgi:hypothetical protein
MALALPDMMGGVVERGIKAIRRCEAWRSPWWALRGTIFGDKMVREAPSCLEVGSRECARDVIY